MGIVNVTPDSFSDGGAWLDPAQAVAHGLRLLDEGADVLDIGGESTRPGAAAVSADEELRRVVPVLRGLRTAAPTARLSIDTAKSAVAAAAVQAGATIVNDVTALGDPDMARVCAQADVELILMHIRGTPRTMQDDTAYGDLIGDVCAWLDERASLAMAAGVRRDRIVLDPGLGFGKALNDNARLIAAIPRLRALGYPVLIGASRKRFIGALTAEPEAPRRIHGSVGAALAAAQRGAAWLRVHDVAATRAALQVFLAVEAAA